MRSVVVSALLALATLGCSTAKEPPAPRETKAQLPELSIDQLDALLASRGCTPVDANGERTRQKLGVIPGAVLLTDSETFTVGELPPDKTRTLVFYCANRNCGASHEAAHKAVTAGYTNVKVLPDGIAGWVKAGKQVQNI